MINSFANMNEQMNKRDLFSIYQSYAFLNNDHRVVMLPGIPQLINSHSLNMSMMVRNSNFKDNYMSRQSMDHDQLDSTKAVRNLKSQLKSKHIHY